MEKQTVNNRVKLLRNALGITQQDFAEKLHLTHSQISAIELGKSILKEQNMLIICTPSLFKKGKEVNSLWLKYGDTSKEHGNQPMFIEIGQTSESMIYDMYGQELPEDEVELVRFYRRLTVHNQVAAIRNIEALLALQEKETQVAGSARAIPETIAQKAAS